VIFQYFTANVAHAQRRFRHCDILDFRRGFLAIQIIVARRLAMQMPQEPLNLVGRVIASRTIVPHHLYYKSIKINPTRPRWEFVHFEI
jgi:hypothetical protein